MYQNQRSMKLQVCTTYTEGSGVFITCARLSRTICWHCHESFTKLMSWSFLETLSLQINLISFSL